MGFMFVWAMVSGILFVVGLIGFCVNKFNYYGEEDVAAKFVIVAVAGLIWPLIVPLGLVGLVVYMALFALIYFEMIKPPKWWR